jgi:hypothetical protein
MIKKGEIIDRESAEDKLGSDLIAEIAEKPWKKANLPSKEDLEKEEHKSSKARSNVNSRKNLVQYRNNVPKETKEAVVKGLKFPKKREDIDPFEFIQIKDESKKNFLKAFLPDRKVLKNAEEEKYFYTVLNAFLQDFEVSELSSSDLEDIVSLAVNRIIEGRLLSISCDKDPNNLLSVSTTIERFRKHSDKIKSNLASRRSDRIDPKSKQNFSIVDIVYAYDDKKKEEFEKRMNKHKNEMDSFVSVFDKE